MSVKSSSSRRLYQRIVSSITTLLILSPLMTTETKAFSAKPTKPAVWNDYKKTLIDAGVLDVQKQRPVIIKAINVADSPESVMRDDTQNDKDGDVITKIIHFQRHGQGYHNLLGDIHRAAGNNVEIDDPNPETNPFVKPEIQDSPLTFKGRTEASSNRIKAAMLSPEVIIVSPLVRALQTAMLSFADHIHGDNAIPFIAHDGCREQLGLLTCNKALPLSQTKSEYPQVDFSLVSHGENDPLWDQYEHRERPLDEANRAYEFLTDFVMKREESEMAIVCHSAWLFCVCNAVIDCEGDEFLESWFETGEIRSVKVTFSKRE